MQWEDDFRAYLMELDKKKPVVLCGDLNVAHEEIDLKNPKSNRGNAGFSDQERGKMTELLSSGFTDTFRALYPDRTGAYTWWSYRFNARKNNAGWRIDYFIVSDRLLPRVRDNIIHAEVEGSDHCPWSWCWTDHPKRSPRRRVPAGAFSLAARHSFSPSSTCPAARAKSRAPARAS